MANPRRVPAASQPRQASRQSPSGTYHRAQVAPPAQGLDFHSALSWIESGRARGTALPRRRRYLVLGLPTEPVGSAHAEIPRGPVLAAFDSRELTAQFVRHSLEIGRSIRVFDAHRGREVPIDELASR